MIAETRSAARSVRRDPAVPVVPVGGHEHGGGDRRVLQQRPPPGQEASRRRRGTARRRSARAGRTARWRNSAGQASISSGREDHGPVDKCDAPDPWPCSVPCFTSGPARSARPAGDMSTAIRTRIQRDRTGSARARYRDGLTRPPAIRRGRSRGRGRSRPRRPADRCKIRSRYACRAVPWSPRKKAASPAVARPPGARWWVTPQGPVDQVQPGAALQGPPRRRHQAGGHARRAAPRPPRRGRARPRPPRSSRRFAEPPSQVVIGIRATGPSGSTLCSEHPCANPGPRSRLGRTLRSALPSTGSVSQGSTSSRRAVTNRRPAGRQATPASSRPATPATASRQRANSNAASRSPVAAASVRQNRVTAR